MKPLILNHPEPMMKVRIITTKDSAEKTLKALHKMGVMHIEEAKELKPVDRAAIETQKKELDELLTFASNVLAYLPTKKRAASLEQFEVIYTKPFREISDEVRLLYSRVKSLEGQISGLAAENQKHIHLRKYLAPLAETPGLALRDLDFTGEYLITRLFVLSGEAYKTAEERLKKYFLESQVFPAENEVALYVILEAKARKIVETQIADAGGRILEIPVENITLKEFLSANEGRTRELESRITGLKQELEKRVGEDFERIFLLREALSAENERLSVLEKAAEANYVSLIQGWVPTRLAADVVAGVSKEVQYAFIDSRAPLDSEQPPTKFDNVAAVKPFQIIVDLFGTPKYREWDPTPIVAFSFAMFFGIMTQDVIYGIGIMLLARFFLPKFVDNTKSEGFRLFQRVLYTGGVVSSVLGLLSGSYLGDIYKMFGIRSVALLKPVEKVFSTPTNFILLAIVIGVIHVNIAHIIALILAIKSKNRGVIITKAGLFAFQLFTLLLTVQKMLKPSFLVGMGMTLQYGMYGSLLMLIIGIIIQNSYFGVLLWVFELTGLLGDALSYSRLAGVGLAGYYLGSAVNMMAGIFRGIIPGPIGLIFGTVAAFFVLVFGHLINNVLMIQGGFVHSMRLCLVEFMFKFYEGGGNKYSPFSLKARESLVIKEKA